LAESEEMEGGSEQIFVMRVRFIDAETSFYFDDKFPLDGLSRNFEYEEFLALPWRCRFL
jgi:hypothetical protein